jgi:hypothetical protein
LDITLQIMIDPDKGVVEGPGAAADANKYCTHQQSDWTPTAVGMAKTIKECTTLQILETQYYWQTTIDRLTKRTAQPEQKAKFLRMVVSTG